MSRHHKKHHRSRAAEKEVSERHMHDTEHEYDFPLEEGLPDGDDIVPVPDRTKTVKKVEYWSSSDSSEHLDETSGEDSEFTDGSTSSGEGEDASSGSESSSGEEKEVFVEVTSKNNPDAIVKRLRQSSMVRMETFPRSVTSEGGEQYEEHPEIETGPSDVVYEQTSGFASKHQKRGKYMEGERGGERVRHKGKRSSTKTYSEETNTSEGRKNSGMSLQIGSYGGKYHSRSAGKGGLPPGVRRGRNGKFQSTSSSGKGRLQRRTSEDQQYDENESDNNTDSSCHMHSERGKTKMAKRGRMGQMTSTSSKNSSSRQTAGKGTRSGPTTGSEATKAAAPNNNIPSANRKEHSSSNLFTKDDTAFDSTIFKIQFRGTPEQLDNLANHDHENRLSLDLGNECVHLGSTTSEEMKNRIHANILKQKAGNPFSTPTLGSLDGAGNGGEDASVGGTKLRGNTNSAGGKGSSSSLTGPDLSSERDLVKQVVVLSGNNPFPHDVEFKLPNIIVPGHHGPGQISSDKGLSVVLAAHENIVQPREIATGRITTDATKYPEIYPQFTRLEDLTKHTFEDKTLDAQKIKHSSERPHPAVHYFQGVVTKREKMSPTDVDSILSPSKDNADYMVMNKEWFDKTVEEMKKSPSVTSKLNNLSDVSNMQVFVVPSESKGDISRVLRQKESSSSGNSSSASGKRTTTQQPTTPTTKNTTSESTKKQRFPSLRKPTPEPTSTQTRSTGGKGDELTNPASPFFLESGDGMGINNTDGDFSSRSWTRSSQSCGHDPTNAKQAFLTIQIKSLPVSGIKKN